jgi:spore coat protein U-like protein
MKRVILAAIILLAPALHAGAANFNMTCTVASSTLTLNAYDVLAGTATSTPTGSITVSCTNTNNSAVTVNYTLALTSTPATRSLTSGANTLTYNLYTDSGTTVIWGNAGTGCTAGSNTNSGNFICGSFSVPKNSSAQQTKNYYAKIPGGSDVPTGTYSENNIAVTLTYSCNPAPTGGGTC